MKEEPQQNSKLSMVLAIVIGIILLTASFLIGFTVGKNTAPETKAPSNGAAQGESEVIQKLLDAGYLPPEFDPNSEIMSTSGQIVETGEGYFKFEAALTPIADKQTYRAAVTENTEIIQRVSKDSDELERQFDQFEEAMANYDPEGAGEPPEPPSPFVEEELNVSDLENGMTVSVRSESNLRENKSFTASSVFVGGETEADIAPAPPAPEPEDIEPIPEPAPEPEEPEEEPLPEPEPEIEEEPEPEPETES